MLLDIRFNIRYSGSPNIKANLSEMNLQYESVKTAQSPVPCITIMYGGKILSDMFIVSTLLQNSDTSISMNQMILITDTMPTYKQ